eukprot:TRINITY_DN22748_c0_g1_i1.p1 TRINITY_DN22748_c0_g1~~TRINITY_DN22748_c0_g1_i1.p1  ORF type:complete len:417 (+),score=162.48 TRINITY_DN22748_c0_g1_i1:56-1306(+)
MKKFLRGAQAVRERVGAVETTTDTVYDDLEKDITKLKKVAKELPKTIEGMQEGLKKMWKAHLTMAREMSAMTTALELSPVCSDMTTKMVDLGQQFEGPSLDKLLEDVNGSAVNILRQLEGDIKGLEHMRTERDKRRLEFGATKEKLRKREEECTKKGKDIESDAKILAIRIELDAAQQSYEVVNRRTIEAMAKVTSVKDDVMKMTVYNVAQYLGEYLRQASGSFLEVKSVYEQGAASAGATFTPPPPIAAVEQAPVPAPVVEAPAPAPAAPAVEAPAPVPVGSRNASSSPTVAPPGLFGFEPRQPSQPPAALGDAPPPVTGPPPAALGSAPPPMSGSPPAALAGAPPPMTAPPAALGLATPAIPEKPKEGVAAYADVMTLGDGGAAPQPAAAAPAAAADDGWTSAQAATDDNQGWS